MKPYRIIMAEKHASLRQAIKKLVQENGELTVVAEAEDGLELLDLLEQSVPDMVITDISMPKLRGLEATKQIKERYPQVKVLILTVYKEKSYLDQAMTCGANGYIVKDEMHDELIYAIQTIRRGQVYISKVVAAGS